MPHNLYQWCWWVFYTGGSLGGWIILLMYARAIRRGLVSAANRQEAATVVTEQEPKNA